MQQVNHTANHEKPFKVLVIGSGPIVIGQAAEFDYAGTQACKSLREEGVTTVLVNSNPATIMTDEDIADIVYIEPLTVEVLTRIIAAERPDGVLPTLGGQTGLNLAVDLADAGVLEKYNVRLLGTPLTTIRNAEDRELFRQLLSDIGEPVLPSAIVESMEEAHEALKDAAAAASRAPGVHAWRHGRRNMPHDGRVQHHRRKRSRRKPHQSGSAGTLAYRLEGNRVRSDARTPPTTASPSAIWRTSTRWASTPATASWSRPARRYQTRNTSCCALSA